MLNVISIFTQYVFCFLLFLNFESYSERFCLFPSYREKSPISSSTYFVFTLSHVIHVELVSVYSVTYGSHLGSVRTCQQSHPFCTFLADSVSWAPGSGCGHPRFPGPPPACGPPPGFRARRRAGLSRRQAAPSPLSFLRFFLAIFAFFKKISSHVNFIINLFKSRKKTILIGQGWHEMYKQTRETPRSAAGVHLGS